jgi:rhodanese-related sulfurtransferase
MGKFSINISFIFLIFFSFSIQSEEIEILFDNPGSGIKILNHYKVKVNYRGILENGTEFDSSFKRNEPFIFQIGVRQVILGWEEGLMGMKVGGKRTIKIPPSLAYGPKGAGDLIPPNSTLIFEIEILDAVPPSYENLLSSDLKNKIQEGFTLIDIRSPNEIKSTGTIEGSLNINAFDIKGNFIPEFISKFQKSVKNSDSVVFISKDGRNSDIIANGFTEQLGLTNMYSLVGGIKNWIEEGRKLTK